MRSWEPRKNQSMAPSAAGSHVDSNTHWSSPTPGPKKSVSSAAHMTPRSNKQKIKHQPQVEHHDQSSNFDQVPRMELFETKANVTYLPDEDDIAALAYANSPKKTPSNRKEGVSGYNFNELLKNQQNPL